MALAVAGSALQAGGTIVGANAQAGQLNSEAGQLDTMAGQDRASGQRAAVEAGRQSRLLSSRALALAAASGGGASDPGVINTISRIAGEGAYQGSVALYQGEEEARSKEMQAIAKRKEADNAKKAGLLNAVGTVLSSGSSLYARFGHGSSAAAAGAGGI